MSARTLLKRAILSIVIPAMLTVSLAAMPARQVKAEEETGAITIHFVPGTTFRVYKVADYADTGKLTLTAPFKDAKVTDLDKVETGEIWDMKGENIGGAKSGTLAENLNAQIKSGAISAPVAKDGTTDDKSSDKGEFPLVGSQDDIDDYSGAVKISGLERGLYLLAGDPIDVEVTKQSGSKTITTKKTYTPYSTMFVVPSFNSDGPSWAYDLDYYSKGEMTEESEEETEYSVVKVWKNDSANVRPKKIEVTILCNGKEFKTVSLDSSNNWTYSWKDKTGASFRVTEKNIPDHYEVQVTRNKTAFVVTNTYNNPPSPPTPPTPTPPTPTPPQPVIPESVPGTSLSTGDETSPLPLIGMVASGAVLMAWGFYVLLRKKENEEY